MTLSFREAFLAKESGAISWDVYISNLLARCRGVKHDKDDAPRDYGELNNIDPFGYSIRLWSDKVGTIKGTHELLQPGNYISPLEAVFHAYCHGTLEDVKTKTALLEGASAEGVNESLALLELQGRRADVLRFCLDTRGQRRFPYQALFLFRDKTDSVDEEKDPETFKTLEESQFRKQVPPRPEYPRKRRDKAGAPPGVHKSFDVGGKYPVNW